jgi:pseudouridine synthase
MARYYMFHKPKGAITARRDERHKTVMDYFPECDRDILFPVGRLDKDTEGLLIVTDDGAFTYRLLSPESGISKTYFFYAQGVLSPDMIAKIESGINIYTHKDFETAPAKITVTETKTLREIKEYLSGKDTRVENRRGDMAVDFAAKRDLRPATEKSSVSASVHTFATSSRLCASEERVTALPCAFGIHMLSSAVRLNSTASKTPSGIPPSCE